MTRILVIDDDPLIQASLLVLLREHGHELFSANNGRQGLRQLKTQSVDLVLTEIVMPDTDGIEVVRAVVHDHPGLALIAMSGGSARLSCTDAVHLALLLGAHAILVKPFTEIDLLAAIETALAATSTPCGQPSSQG